MAGLPLLLVTIAIAAALVFKSTTIRVLLGVAIGAATLESVDAFALAARAAELPDVELRGEYVQYGTAWTEGRLATQSVNDRMIPRAKIFAGGLILLALIPWRLRADNGDLESVVQRLSVAGRIDIVSRGQIDIA